MLLLVCGWFDNYTSRKLRWRGYRHPLHYNGGANYFRQYELPVSRPFYHNDWLRRPPLAFPVCHISFLLSRTFSGICLAALGFLPGKEVKNAKIGNLGLQDRESQLANLHRL